MSNNRSSNPLWKKFVIVVSLNSENSRKVAKFANYLDVSRTALTTIKKHKDQIITYIFFSDYTQKNNTAIGNHKHRTLLSIAKLWQLKCNLRNAFL